MEYSVTVVNPDGFNIKCIASVTPVTVLDFVLSVMCHFTYVRDRVQVSLLILSEYKQIDQLLFSQK